MNKISIYGHSGSYNHGNEAVVRGLCNIMKLNYKPDLYCAAPYIDRIFNLDERVNLIKEGNEAPFLKRTIGKILRKLTGSERYLFLYKYQNLIESVRKDKGVYLFTAEDQYNEIKQITEWFQYQNREINKYGGKTIAIGATIGENKIGESAKLEDLSQYQMVIARESITYGVLKKHGINAVFAPCTAFALEKEDCILPKVFEKDVIGINAYPLAQGHEKYTKLYYDNVINLIEFILNQTDFNIALISHMNWGFNTFSDLDSHKIFLDHFENNSRIGMVREHNAPQSKYIIGKCRMMITTRTHVSIPAYAECVPTLVTGYKMKSIGIAKDIFGDYHDYVMSIQDLKTKKDFIKGFKWLMDNEDSIRAKLKMEMPIYIARTKLYKDVINKVANE